MSATFGLNAEKSLGKHRIYYAACTVSYWKNGVAATAGEEFTHRRLETNAPCSHSLDFENTDEGYAQFTMTMWMLEDAWASGIREQQHRVKEVLGIKDPRT